MKSFVVFLLAFQPKISSFVDQCPIHWAIELDKAEMTKPLSLFTIVRTSGIKQEMW